MKNMLIQGTSVLLSTFLLVGCGDGACCEDGVKVLSKIEPKSTITNEATKIVLVEEQNEPKEFIVPNTEPHAIAYANDSRKLVKVNSCEYVNFDASSSYGMDGNDQNLSYLWRNMDSLIVSDEPSYAQRFDHKGLYEMTLIVIDDDNLTAVDRVCVLVNMEEEDIPLSARAGEDLNVHTDKKVSLSGRSFCRDDILKYEWKEGSKLLSSEASFETQFETGQHILNFTIEDIEGNRATDSVVINVI